MTILNKVRNWKQQRDTQALLRNMSPRQLEDIGIPVAGINAVVRHPIDV